MRIALILLISIAYTLATFQGASLQPLPVTDYICRPTLSGTFNRALWHFLDGIAHSRLGSIFPKLVGFSLDSDESQASQTPLFSTRASRSIPDPEYLVALLSPLENLEGSGLRGDRLIKMILLMAIAYTSAIFQGIKIQKKQLQKYVSRSWEPRKKYRRRSTFGVGKDGEQWVDYLERHSLEIQQLMKLTRNKRRFSQQGIRAATLLASIS